MRICFFLIIKLFRKFGFYSYLVRASPALTEEKDEALQKKVLDKMQEL